MRYDPAMFWLRWVFFSSPLWLGFAGAWLFRTVAEFHLVSESDALVHAINQPVGWLTPLTPVDGIDGEIADLIFEPLLRRDGNLNLRPNLIERWTSRTVVTIRCESEEAAGEAEARIRAGEAPAKGPRPIALERTGDVLTAAFEGAAPDLETPLLEGLPGELLADDTLVRVTAEHSVDDLIGAWLKVSVEKAPLRLLEFSGDREANLFVRGDTERLLKELRLYLDANPSTSPALEILGRRSHTLARETLLDLRTDAVWHDGHPFTAQDVAFSYETLTRPGSPLPLAGGFAFVESVETTSPHRLRVRCREAPATMLESWEKLPVLPAHLLAGAGGPAAYEAYAAHPVGLGPYRLERRRTDGGVELVAHAGYHAGAPKEPRLRYRHFASLESILLALRTGSLDGIEPDERFTEWTSRHPGHVETVRDVPRFQHFVVWNLDRPPFDRTPVRQALARAADPASILRDTAAEFQTPVASLFFPGLPHVAEPMLLPLHDPRGAENLLEKEGYARDAESGRRKDEEGRTLGFTLLVNEANAEHRRLATALAEQWAAVGIEAKVEPLPWEELLSRRLAPREFDAALLSWAIPFGLDRREVWHSSAAGPGGGNLGGLRDAEVDALLDRLRDEADPAKVAETTAALQRAIAALQPCLFVCDSGRIVTLRTDALEMRPPGAESPSPLALGKGGLKAARPWWIRKQAAP